MEKKKFVNKNIIAKQTTIKETCCCHNEDSKKVDNKQTEKKEACCCHNEDSKKVDNKQIEKKETCCCHNEDSKKVDNKQTEEKEACCCHNDDSKKVDNKQTEKKEDCCCHNEESKKVDNKQTEKKEACCCHNEDNKKENIIQTTTETKNCCCGGSHKASNSESGACCHSHNSEKSTFKIDMIILAISLAVLIVGFFNWHKYSMSGNAIAVAFYYVNPSYLAVVLCGAPIFASAIRILKKRKVNASVLISMGILASLGLEIASFFVSGEGMEHSHSYVFAAGEIAFLMKIGEMLEAFTVGKCRSGIDRLVGLIPKEASVVIDGNILRRNLSEIVIGDIVVVKAGEMVSVDGVVTDGEGSIDTSSVTGEYLPKEVKLGDKVYGGTFNKSGVIYIKVEKLQKDMTIAKMAELTKEAEGKKAPVSRLADRWVGYIVPTVFVVSIIVGLLSGFVFKIGIMQSFIRAITVLVVFCPCALALATPTAIAAGLGNSAKNGVLIKSGAILEELSRIDSICFDKTGTLTEGIIMAQEVVSLGDKEEFLKYLASCENFSDHPIAKAIVSAYNGKLFDKVSNVQTLHGVGLVAQVNGKRVQILSIDNAIKNNIDLSAIKDGIDGCLAKGQTVVVGIIDDKAQGFISVSDTIRENAKQTIANLHQKNYKTFVLTGDNKQSAYHVASLCGIDGDEVKYSLMPEDKLSAIEQLQAEGKKVCMLGDGINDAPSLKLANCGVAMGALGSDIAIDSADIAIMNSDIGKLENTLDLSKRVMNAIKRNIIIAMTINVISVVLSTFGFLTPVTGAIVHNVTSILVVASSSFLLISSKKKLIKKK